MVDQLLQILNQQQSINANINKVVSQENGNNDSIFASQAKKTNQVNDPHKPTQGDKAKLNSALQAEIARIQAANDPIIQAAIQEAIHLVTEQVIAAVIRAKLNDDEADVGSLAKIPSVKGINGGAGVFSAGSITNNTFGLVGPIYDYATAQIEGSNGQTLFSDFLMPNAISRSGASISFDESIVKKEVLQYFGQQNYLSDVSKMKPGEFIVFEKNRKTGTPIVWAEKKENGNVIININKNGLRFVIELKDSEIKQAESSGGGGGTGASTGGGGAQPEI